MKRNKLIVIGLYTAIGLAFSGVSFSLAWYNSSTNLQITQVEITIDTERDLKISKTLGGQYVSDYTSADFPGVGLFTPVSTSFSSSWINKKQDHPTFYDASYAYFGVNDTPTAKTASRGFFNQDFYLEADDDVYVGLDMEADATFFKANQQKNAEYASFLYARTGEYTREEYEKRLNHVQYSGRIALLDPDDMNFTIIDPYKGEEETLLGGPLDNDGDGFYDYYENLDGEKKEIFYGEIANRNKLIYQEPVTAEVPVQGGNEGETTIAYVDEKATGENTSFHAGHKAGVKKIDIDKSIQNGADIQVEETIAPAEILDADDRGVLPPFYLTLKAYTPKRINLSFYLEGWDKDSVNGSMGSSFDMKVSFKIIREI